MSMNASLVTTTVTRMPTVPTPLVGIIVLARKDILEMVARVQVNSRCESVLSLLITKVPECQTLKPFTFFRYR